LAKEKETKSIIDSYVHELIDTALTKIEQGE
jgi:hypothetical protein